MCVHGWHQWGVWSGRPTIAESRWPLVGHTELRSATQRLPGALSAFSLLQSSAVDVVILRGNEGKLLSKTNIPSSSFPRRFLLSRCIKYNYTNYHISLKLLSK